MNSNCCRVDTVKSRATQLRMQLDQISRAKTDQSEDFLKAHSEVQSLDAAVKKGNAQEAETALSGASAAVHELQANAPQGGLTSRGLDVYA